MHADPSGSPDRDHRVGDLEHQPRPVLDRAAIFVGPDVRTVLEELVEQITVGAVDLDAVEAGEPGVLGALAVLLDDAGDLVDLERPGRDERLLGFQQARVPAGCDGARRDRQRTVQVIRVRHPAHVPKLEQDAATRLVDGTGDELPALDLLGRPDAGRVRIAHAHRRDRRRLGDDQAGRCTLGVVLTHQGIRHPPRAGAATRQGRHDDPVRQLQVADLDRVEKRGHRWFPLSRRVGRDREGQFRARNGSPLERTAATRYTEL